MLLMKKFRDCVTAILSKLFPFEENVPMYYEEENWIDSAKYAKFNFRTKE